MKRKIIVLILVVVILLTGFVIYKDIAGSKFLSNKGKGEVTVSDQPGKIALIDDGFDLKSVKSSPNLKITQYNSMKDNEDIKPIGKRGTVLFSGLYNNQYSLGLKNEAILIKAFDYPTIIDAEQMAKAIDFAVKEDAKLIVIGVNMDENESISKSIKAAQEKGISIVTTANDGKSSTLMYPATLENVISVSDKTNDAKSTVKVDTTMQQVCVAKKCKPNKHIALATASVGGYLLDFKDPYQEALNLEFKMSYGPSATKIEKEK